MNKLRYRVSLLASVALIFTAVMVSGALGQQRPGAPNSGGVPNPGGIPNPGGMPNPGNPNPGGMPNPGVQTPGFPGGGDQFGGFTTKVWTCSKCGAELARGETEPTHITRCPKCGVRLSSSSGRTFGWIAGGVV